MAPVTIFVKISRTKSIPLRIFINRKSIIKQSTLFEAAISSANTTNHRALVRLKTTQRLLISNRQLREFIQVIKDDLLDILFNFSNEVLIMKNQGSSKESFKIMVEKKGWSCNVIFNPKYITMLREGDYSGLNGTELLIRQPKKQSKSGSEGVDNGKDVPELLVEEEEEVDLMKIPEEGEQVDMNEAHDENDGDNDDKKQNLKYDYKSSFVLGKGLKIELLQIPRN